MSSRQYAGRQPLARRYEYADTTVLAFDLGVPEDAVSVDVVGETAILTIETATGSRTEEIDLPTGDAGVFMSNGILTIEVEQ